MFESMSSYSLRLASGGGVSPNKPKAFVYQVVIFTTEAALDAVDASQGVEEQAHTSKDCMKDDLQDTKT